MTACADGPLPGWAARVRYGEGPERSWAVIAPASPVTLRAFTLGDALRVCTDELTAEVSASCQLSVADATGTTLLQDAADGGYFEAPDGSRGVVRDSPPDERYFGLGEKSGTLPRRCCSMAWRSRASLRSQRC
jgi:hypothetical protein